LLVIMNNMGNLPCSESAARRVRKPGQRPRGRPRKASAAEIERHTAPVGSLTRTKSLLLAALRVWELKHRISD
jgi:hypothetical protein